MACVTLCDPIGCGWPFLEYRSPNRARRLRVRVGWMRTLHALGLGYVAVCGAVLVLQERRAPDVPAPVGVVRVTPPAPPASPATDPHPAPAPPPGDARAWFEAARPFCNALEVANRMRYSPAPAGTAGAGYGASCYALAGNIDSARVLIERLDHNQRPSAAGIVFEVGHPVADAGDDRSAGPMMELVIAYQPDNYMALYHAGMSEYALGDEAKARKNLRRFLELYTAQDGWRTSALGALRQLGVASP